MLLVSQIRFLLVKGNQQRKRGESVADLLVLLQLIEELEVVDEDEDLADHH